MAGEAPQVADIDRGGTSDAVRNHRVDALFCPADRARFVDDQPVLLARTAGRFPAPPAATCIPLTGLPAFTFGVASGVDHPELQAGLVELTAGAARSEPARRPGRRPPIAIVPTSFSCITPRRE